MASSKRLSFCITTKGRDHDVLRLCESLSQLVRLGFEDWEIIFVDQNADSRIQSIAETYRQRLPHVEYISTPHDQGASKGRNVAAQVARGRWFLFVDDDAWMIPNVFSLVAQKIIPGDEDILWLGRMVDHKGHPIKKGYPTTSRFITDSRDLWAVSGFIMIARRTWNHVGPYDEHLGVGTHFGGDEDTDLVLRAMAQGCRILFDPELCYGHVPNPHPSDEKVLGLARGRGALLRKYETTAFGPGLQQALRSYLWEMRWKRPVVRVLGQKESAHHKALILSGVPQGYRDWRGIYG
ncbi:glycosyltransferase family 2 protein [Sulfobacillus thermosulfidooxidans]|uniref:glycosyltransferase family 2 protein n=1 Tax=Sulfobacillus thermosulfidooxidans TaxID=28034 RepID=UPI00096BB5CD|nr:glycosyltransferase family 2 protein [Sulfobacillus thermosulfidooxidans]OLZ09099.1 hypothetical protein BFX05_02540 [Sulfobacillus thermosulfidooxidans]OLZ15148.1 hypothetical protein BFX06_04210 [Sulfobacillus thermosulfidooxidans]OLZ22137.1 hypothetical protein BFX07_09730 [Sulfobacillus thermosulfidooxidans]